MAKPIIDTIHTSATIIIPVITVSSAQTSDLRLIFMSVVIVAYVFATSVLDVIVGVVVGDENGWEGDAATGAIVLKWIKWKNFFFQKLIFLVFSLCATKIVDFFSILNIKKSFLQVQV